MRSIRDIVQNINDALCGVFKGAQVYGIARTAIREDGLIPVIQEKYIGIDDNFALQVYHKINGITISTRPGSGVGRDPGHNVNTFQMSMIVYSSEKRTKLAADQIALIIQSVVPKIISSDFFLSIRTQLTSVILNSQQVYAQEYKSDTFRLDEYQSLTQINYTVEIAFKTGCFDICPEDLEQCKN